MFFSKKLKKGTPEDSEKLRCRFDENQVGAKDTFAMLVSAFLVLVLPSLLVLGVLCFLVLLLFGAL